jgi:hypothetical protein
VTLQNFDKCVQQGKMILVGHVRYKDKVKDKVLTRAKDW